MISKKHFMITFMLSALFLSACSFDQRYRYEANGNEDYLNTAPLRPITIPKGLKLPDSDEVYSIFMPITKGETGMKVDIFPPSLPLATVEGSFAEYRQGIAWLETSAKKTMWPDVVAVLKGKSIPIKSQTHDEIITGDIIKRSAALEIPYKATYRISWKKVASRQRLTVELLSLRGGKNDLFSDPIYKQRYTVNFFNSITLELEKNNTNPFQ